MRNGQSPENFTFDAPSDQALQKGRFLSHPNAKTKRKRRSPPSTIPSFGEEKRAETTESLTEARRALVMRENTLGSIEQDKRTSEQKNELKAIQQQHLPYVNKKLKEKESNQETEEYLQKLISRQPHDSKRSKRIVPHLTTSNPLIPFGGVKLYAPTTAPYDTKEETIDFSIRNKAIREKVNSELALFRSQLETTESYELQEAAKRLDFDKMAVTISNSLIKVGGYWDDPKKQEWFIRQGFNLLVASQVAEFGYVTSGLILSCVGVSPSDIPFWLGLAPTILAFPGTLLMNIALVDPYNEVRDELCPPHLHIDCEHFKLTGEIKFQNPDIDSKTGQHKYSVIDRDGLGFKNDFAARFFLEKIGPLALEEGDEKADWHWPKLVFVVTLFNKIYYLYNNFVGPLGNALSLLLLIDIIVDHFFDGNPLLKLILGVLASLPFELVGAIYYIALGRGPMEIANKITFSARNPILQAFRISKISALRSLFFEYIPNGILRGATVSLALLYALERLALPKLIPDQWPDVNNHVGNVTAVLIALYTLFTRFRAFDEILDPLKFPTPDGLVVILTNTQALDYWGVRPTVINTLSRGEKIKLLRSAAEYGLCFSTAAFIVLRRYPGLTFPVALPAASLSVFALTTLIYYFSNKDRYTNRVSRAALDILCGIEKTMADYKVVRLAMWAVRSDFVSRILGRAGGIKLIPIVAALAFSGLELWILCVAISAISLIPEANFFLKLMLRTAPKIIAWVQRNAIEDEKSQRGLPPPSENGDADNSISSIELSQDIQSSRESPRTTAKPKRGCCGGVARALMRTMPFFFAPETKPDSLQQPLLETPERQRDVSITIAEAPQTRQQQVDQAIKKAKKQVAESNTSICLVM